MSAVDSASTFLAAERTYLAWVRTCLAVLGFGLAFARLFPVSIYGVNMSNYIAYASIGSSLFLLVDATTRFFIRQKELEEGNFTPGVVGPTVLFISVMVIVLVPAAIGRRSFKKHKRRYTVFGGDTIARGNNASMRKTSGVAYHVEPPTLGGPSVKPYADSGQDVKNTSGVNITVSDSQPDDTYSYASAGGPPRRESSSEAGEGVLDGLLEQMDRRDQEENTQELLGKLDQLVTLMQRAETRGRTKTFT
eukprot:m.155098 g.155098  ORF g.155098 m.155098 type:complete len:249 (+) comp17928_c0_seq1:221-967(+)